jgi:formylglycine-generating enzyme required for sulfatase activity
VQSTIVLTSRWVGYRSQAVPPEFWRLRILSLNDKDGDEHDLKRRLLQRWYTARGLPNPVARGEATLDKLRGHLRQFTDTPLLLHLVAWLDEKGKKLGTMRHEVYRDVIDAVIAGEYRSERTEGEKLPDVARDVLRALALHLARAGATHRGRDELCRAVEGQGHPRQGEIAENVKVWHKDARVVLETIARHTGLVRPREGFATADAEWGFWIKPFQDALLGEFLFFEVYEKARAAAEKQNAALAQKRGAKSVDPHQEARAGVRAFLLDSGASTAETREEFYGEAVALLGGWVPSAERQAWVLLLLEDEALGLPRAAVRALAYLGDVACELIARVLRGRTEADERARFYARLVELAPDRRTAVEQLDACALSRSAQSLRDQYEIDMLLTRVCAEADTDNDAAGSHAAVKARDALFGRLGRVGITADAVRSAFACLPDGKPTWCEIEAGWYRRGSSKGEGHADERPAMPLHISKPFVIGATTITQEQYALFDPGYKQRWNGAHMPATEVTWYAATMFARWLGHHLGVEGRLPTEAEWEYACRGMRCDNAADVHNRDWPPYWCGRELIPGVARFGQGPEGEPRAVHDGIPNSFGLRNVHGNVWEWCAEGFHEYGTEDKGPGTNPFTHSVGADRLLRGGAYWNEAEGCRAAGRDVSLPVVGDVFFGFRVVLKQIPKP